MDLLIQQEILSISPGKYVSKFYVWLLRLLKKGAIDAVTSPETVEKGQINYSEEK
jgi:hypothetical protein